MDGELFDNAVVDAELIARFKQIARPQADCGSDSSRWGTYVASCNNQTEEEEL